MVDLGSIAFGAFGTALVTVIAGFIGAGIASGREHTKWVRQQRFDAYTAFLLVAERHLERQNADEQVHDAHLDDFGSRFATIELVGPDDVAEAARKHLGAAMAYSTANDRENAVNRNDEVALADAAMVVRAAAKNQAATRRAFAVAARKHLRFEK